MIKKIILLIIISLLLLNISAWAFKNIQWMCEKSPPYNYVDKNGIPKGIVFDILMEIFKRTGIKKGSSDIKFLPWARAYQILKSTPNTALFSMVYSPSRQKLFKFVGPIIDLKISIIAPKKRQLKVNCAEDINKLRIGVIRQDIGESLLSSFGVDKNVIKRHNQTLLMVKKLAMGRLDAIAYALDTAIWVMKNQGINYREYEEVYTLQKSKIGYAFHKDTDQLFLGHIQKTLDELRADGTIDQILLRYLK